MSDPATFFDSVNNTAAGPAPGNGSRAFAPVARPAQRAPEPRDWSQWYLRDEDDEVGQSPEHMYIVDGLFEQCCELARERGWTSAHVGKDQFIGWKKEHELVRVSPDVYIIDSPLARMPTSWETWRPGHAPPRFAVEVVSTDWRKDYVDNPDKYASMGARELVLVDPYAFAQPRRAQRATPRRVPLQVFRLGPGGEPEQVAAGAGPLYCSAIDAYVLFCADSRGTPRVRISRDPAGRDLVPTADERAAAEAARANALAAERDALAAERDALAAAHEEAKAEREAANTRAQAAAAERDAAIALLRKHGLI